MLHTKVRQHHLTKHYLVKYNFDIMHFFGAGHMIHLKHFMPTDHAVKVQLSNKSEANEQTLQVNFF